MKNSLSLLSARLAALARSLSPGERWDGSAGSGFLQSVLVASASSRVKGVGCRV